MRYPQNIQVEILSRVGYVSLGAEERGHSFRGFSSGRWDVKARKLLRNEDYK